jgi:hypothetical protein
MTAMPAPKITADNLNEVFPPVIPASWHRSTDAKGITTHSLLAKDGGTLLAQAVRTGRAGIDDYPWDWYLAYGIKPVPGHKASGVTDTLREAKEKACAAAGAARW